MENKKECVQNRIESFDVARGIAMVAIILGHFGNSCIERFVFTFHVPLFFILSGIFFDIKRNNRKRTEKLIKPYVFTVICLAVLDVMKTGLVDILSNGRVNMENCVSSLTRTIIAGLYGSGSRTDFFGYTIPAIGAIWFFLAMIWGLLLTSIIIRCANGKRNAVLIVIVSTLFLWMLGFFSARITWLPLSIQAGFCSVIFIIIGICLKKLDLKTKSRINDKEAYIILLGAVIWAISIVFSYKIGNMSLVRCFFPNPIINIMGASAATVFICAISFYIKSSAIGRFLSFFGRNSMIVLSFHLMELNEIPWNSIFVDNAPNAVIGNVIVFIARICWCLFGIYIVNKIYFCRKIFSIK